MTLSGIDVAVYQGQINWSAVAVDFAIAKASEGVGFRDPQFTANWAGMKTSNIPVVGAYHFARPDLGNLPEAEADWFLAVVGDLPKNAIVALDLETGAASLGHWALRWLGHVQTRLSGYKPFFYSYHNFITTRGISAAAGIEDYPLWLAWPDMNGPLPAVANWSEVVIQQYGEGAVRGINAQVDLNRAAKSLSPYTVGGSGGWPEEDDMQLILAVGDGTDPIGPGAVYLVLAQSTPTGFVPWGEKRWIDAPPDAAPYSALPQVKVNQFELDRCERGPDVASGSYPLAASGLLEALKTELDALGTPTVDVAKLAPALASALAPLLPTDAGALAKAVVARMGQVLNVP